MERHKAVFHREMLCWIQHFQVTLKELYSEGDLKLQSSGRFYTRQVTACTSSSLQLSFSKSGGLFFCCPCWSHSYSPCVQISVVLQPALPGMHFSCCVVQLRQWRNTNKPLTRKATNLCGMWRGQRPTRLQTHERCLAPDLLHLV